jgi:hypothetical protein
MLPDKPGLNGAHSVPVRFLEADPRTVEVWLADPNG